MGTRNRSIGVSSISSATCDVCKQPLNVNQEHHHAGGGERWHLGCDMPSAKNVTDDGNWQVDTPFEHIKKKYPTGIFELIHGGFKVDASQMNPDDFTDMERDVKATPGFYEEKEDGSSVRFVFTAVPNNLKDFMQREIVDPFTLRGGAKFVENYVNADSRDLGNLFASLGRTLNFAWEEDTNTWNRKSEKVDTALEVANAMKQDTEKSPSRIHQEAGREYQRYVQKFKENMEAFSSLDTLNSLAERMREEPFYRGHWTLRNGVARMVHPSGAELSVEFRAVTVPVMDGRLRTGRESAYFNVTLKSSRSTYAGSHIFERTFRTSKTYEERKEKYKETIAKWADDVLGVKMGRFEWQGGRIRGGRA